MVLDRNFPLMNLFVLVFAKDSKNINRKLEELSRLNLPFLIVTGEKTDLPHTIYRKPEGKFDAINFGLTKVPKEYDVIALNDVDTRILNFDKMIKSFSKVSTLVFAGVKVNLGPQVLFYRILDAVRRRLLITASGELMLVQRSFIDSLLPIKPCKAEDSYILFKALKLKQRVSFCETCYVITERTKTPKMEEKYKRKTVCGLYQAVELAKPPVTIRTFYFLLPFVSPLLMVLGEKGYFWMRGIMLGFADFLHKDKTGTWSTAYMA